MGRSSYTASTTSHLAHAAHSSGSHAFSHAGESSHNKPAPAPLALHANSTSESSHAASRAKDTPTVWAQKAFDPDDETLPSIEERFLDPYEQLEEIMNARGNLHADGGDEDEDECEYEEPDSDPESTWDDEEGGEDSHYPDSRQLPQVLMHSRADLHAPEGEDANDNAIMELATALMQQRPPHHQEADGMSASEYEEDDYREERHAHEQQDEDDDDDEPPHGNGGYYDYGYSRADEQVIDRRSTPSIADDFSPSAGVFHRHTLPFNLPDMGEMQLQRRSSNNMASNVSTPSVSTFAF